MGNFINAGRRERVKLGFSILEQVKSGEEIEMADLTTATSQLINNYHNQLCGPNESWTTREEIEALPRLLRLLADGVEKLENIEK